MKHKIFLMLIFSAALSWYSTPSHAQQAKYYALFVVKFTDYIQWPESKVPIVIGVYGNSEIISELGKFSAKNKIEVLEMSSPSDIQKCQLVFLGNTKKGEFQSIKSNIGDKSILLVTENGDLVTQGAGISFYADGSKLRFKINKKITDTQNLKVSGSLLALADVI